MRKGIEIAETYFTELDHNAALVILDRLRQKFERD
ncbi:hypothetical protein CLV59_107380 [Chitinophaga dinghuensis]|uniref:Uncharacterized protein n=1 Tax=Chitinophaga dinghuensis TaxID=1539050 RepID=A0A327VQZ4_9BACT|nr:hypothetical protein CLV59_107380 [Chitinophaga dinghuensis]